MRRASPDPWKPREASDEGIGEAEVVAKNKQSSSRGRILAGSSSLALSLALLSPAFAQTISVGDNITNPETGATEVVTQVTGDAVVTDAGNVIVISTAVGSTFEDPTITDPDAAVVIVEVAAQIVDPTTMLVDQLVLTDGRTIDVVQPIPSEGAEIEGGDSGGALTLPTVSGNVNIFTDAQQGSNGGNGRDGGGVKIAGVLIGVSSKSGGDGGDGPTITGTYNGSDATSVSGPAVYIASIGGDGGQGGDEYGVNVDGSPGGQAGAGGTVTITSTINAATGGDGDSALLVQSLAGQGGEGGSGYIIGDGARGGLGNNGGNVDATNTGNLSTTGTNAAAFLVQSMGGNSGAGGGSFGIAGSGGDAVAAGDGGTVVGRNEGTIVTTGNGGHGMLVQSVGGIGGASGNAGNLFASFGATAGRGGDGGDATGENAGSITTTGDGAVGMLVQSVGGNGGVGGWSASAFVSLGGGGGTGGQAGDVTGRNLAGGFISTEGLFSHGMQVQSVGGGGGRGGVGGAIVGLGADGGDGGDGGNVTVFNEAGSTIITDGYASHGVFAQSVGGGGGSGATGGGLVAIGGDGASAANGGTVTITNGSAITTNQDISRGIFAQSVGGGGGSAMGTGGLVSIGGAGGTGGNAGDVFITNSGAITTSGLASDAIFAQSVGGGGGDGAHSGGLVSLGGAGTAGGTAGEVRVTNTGTLSTNGERARGIFAQSVGGGGGTGGDAGGAVSIGGSAGGGSNGDDVTVSNQGFISTQQDLSHGIQAQSIGGGGGDGGLGGGLIAIGGTGTGGGDGGDVGVTNEHDITTLGDDAFGIFAQSVGGGGGNGGSANSVSLFAGVAIGGAGGMGSEGGVVDVDFGTRSTFQNGSFVDIDPTISTSGDRSIGVMAQSVGGGGGNGGSVWQVTAGYAASASIAVGGSAGAGGDGGIVNATGDANIFTQGDSAQGLFLQSVGGGGGNGGGALSIAASGGDGVAGSLSVAVGGSGGSGGDGKEVTLDGGGNIATEGAFSEGALIQSVGGGGGNGGYSVAVSVSGAGGLAAAISIAVGGSGGSGGDGGEVNATYAGNITTGVSGSTDETDGFNSDAFIAQSVGGGGGNGGVSVSASVAGSGGLSVSVPIGVGGSGGSGGDGDAVTTNFTGDIITYGSLADGHVAQSVGGGGGNGGFNVSAGLAFSGGTAGSIGVGVGGFGATGGDAGIVNASHIGNITTHAADSNGFIAQSVGGGGGNGAFNITGAISGSGGAAGSLTVGVGGFGDAGGQGRAVTANVDGLITTLGDGATAVTAQSVGGGGGNGGFNVSANANGSGGVAGALAVGVGGFGGDGGQSGNVDLTVGGTVSTSGDRADAILAQSIGGGGGNGAFNVTGTFAASSGVAASLGVGVGGFGGTGGSSGNTSLQLDGNALTSGVDSDAVTVQAIGGGGGNGGFNINGAVTLSQVSGNLGVGVGGFGGTGANAGNASAGLNGAFIMTTEDQSSGLTVQSLGGGGGNGGFNIAGGIAAGSSVAGTLNVGVGGFGDGGGNAGTATLTGTGTVMTEGTDANAILVQSLGGGGGNGGFNITGGISASGSAAGTIGVGVGGFGGGAGDGSAVTVSYSGGVSTLDDRSAGATFQSLGGGGGNGAFNITGGIAGSSSAAGVLGVGLGGFGGGGGNGGDLNVDYTGVVITNGLDSYGVLAQSVGGGGGNGSFNITGSIAGSSSVAGTIGFGLGGFGGTGGAGGTVLATHTGTISSTGEGAYGATFQSLGGGGGNGGFNVEAGIALSNSTSASIGVGVGGFGGAGGLGGDVTANQFGNVTTSGLNAHGVLVQSVGGGGGNGAFNIRGGIAASTSLAASVGVGIGGFGGDGGVGGNVVGRVEGDILTDGNNAFGAMFQSVGGGGGNGGLNVTGGISLSKTNSGVLGVGIGGFGGTGGEAGTVDATFIGDVATLGDSAHGVVIQSLGGGGGNGGLNVTGGIAASKSNAGTFGFGLGGFGSTGGDAEVVTASVTSSVGGTGYDIVTDGDAAYGVLAQSAGGGGGTGGLNVTGGITAATDNSVPITLGLGGFGGGAGVGRSVELDVFANVQTLGSNSTAVIAQSLGGGGGSGGLNVSGGIAVSTTGNAIPITLGLGGFGGDGGNSGAVDLDFIGNVEALGTEEFSVEDDDDFVRNSYGGGSSGIIAQSVGGSGGNGGMNVSGGIALTKDVGGSAGVALTVGIGGFSGGGGDADAVDLSVLSDTIAIYGDDQVGVLAQSVGGGGGNGGINISGGITMDGQLNFGMGGFGADGGVGEDVSAVVEAGLITAIGNNARGILVQSIGGGGGNGGINVTGSITARKDDEDPQLSIGIGGFGGTGNRAGDVGVDHDGEIVVRGGDTAGILAQSVGGGGGAGGLNVTGAISRSDSFTLGVGVGGTGGTGANAGDVFVASDGNITVIGANTSDDEDTSFFTDAANAVLSILPDSLQPETDEGRAFYDYQERANGILAQSIGGGGGVGGMNVTGVITPDGSPLGVGVGGTGGAGGEAGDVLVERGMATDLTAETILLSSIITTGNDANGITAQSIGGGGGQAGMNFVTTISSRTNEDQNQYNLQLTIGGDGGVGSDGGNTTVMHVGAIQTAGEGADGIVAQSVGGGGGDANYNVALGRNKKARGINLGIGGAPSDGGHGGAVVVDHFGTITTGDDDSVAIFAQSVGGGGGSIATNMNTSLNNETSIGLSIGRLGGDGGNASTVSVVSDGILSTTGDRSSAIYAQSVGGGGGRSSSITASFSNSTGQGTDRQSQALAVSVGLEGGAGGASDAVAVDASGSIFTNGSDAHGIFAQSVGGGGGTGGAVFRKFSGSDYSAAVGVGGTGGTGGKTSTVDVISAADIDTSGEESHAIWAQSVGGGGGDGGLALVGTIQYKATKSGDPSNTFSISVGGTGGDALEGEAVTVASSGTLITRSDDSDGIRAQSVGGGGGNGGMQITGEIIGKGDANSFGIAVGGDGSSGARGGLTTVTNTGSIVTLGDRASGINAQSVGGGGGEGGMVVDITVPVLSKTQRSLGLDIGGNGGTGGVGGDVIVTNTETGSIMTAGEKSYGIFAQSVGGGGGQAGSVYALSVQRNGNTDRQSFNVGLSLGGQGGDGNDAGDVTVTHDGIIGTQGDEAHGIFAQSVGGGGGDGGIVVQANMTMTTNDRAYQLAIGGSGGDGGDGGDVLVQGTGSITTTGASAHGIFAQSVGGGGGNAGVAILASSSPIATVASNVIANILGATEILNGSGGMPGNVTVTHTGDITVMGEGSQAVKTEMVSGGGGSLLASYEDLIVTIEDDFTINSVNSADSSVDDNFSTNDARLLKAERQLVEMRLPEERTTFAATDSTLSFRLGAEDADGFNAGNASSTTSGSLQVGGANGTGLSAASIGGGGGSLALNIGLGAASESEGLIVPVITLGSTESDGAAGGAVSTTHTGSILTNGQNTIGLIAQSVGGGGGRGYLNVSGEASELGRVALSFGATGGSTQSAGGVSIDQDGSVTTTDALATAVLAQSIGGGGGSFAVDLSADGVVNNGVDVVLGGGALDNADGGSIAMDLNGGLLTFGDYASALVVQSIGGSGGEARILGSTDTDLLFGAGQGSGGDIALTNQGAIDASGDHAHAVVLQSIGGSGGLLYTDGLGSVGQASGTSIGDGGAISFSQTGDIIARGNGAHALVVQSLGGGGGLANGATYWSGGTGSGGAISLDLQGNVVAFGEDTIAIIAESLGSDEQGGDIAITIGEDFIVMAEQGVALAGGSSNTLLNYGAIFPNDGIDGLAISGTWGDDAVTSYGEVWGDILLGTGTNSFTNAVDAIFVTGNQVDLGAAENLFTNSGFMAIRGDNLAGRTDLDGSFVQTEEAEFEAELDFASGILDALFVSGTAEVAGTFDVDLLNIPSIRAGSFSTPLVATEGGVVDNGALLETDPSLVINYWLATPNTDLTLQYVVDFNVEGLEGNRQDVGEYINRIQNAGSNPAFAQLITGLVTEDDLGIYSNTVTQLASEFFAEQQAQSLLSTLRFGDSITSCGGELYARPGQDHSGCAWAGWRSVSSRKQAHKGFQAVDHDGLELHVGDRHVFGSGASLTLGLEYSQIDALSADRGWFSESERLRVGVGGDMPVGPVSVSGQVSFGLERFETVRVLDATTPREAESARDITTLGASFAVEHNWERGNFRVTPSFTLAGAYLSADKFRENGADEQNLILEAQEEGHVWIEQKTEFSYSKELPSGNIITPFASLGASASLTNPHTAVDAQFQGAPVGIAAFENDVSMNHTHVLGGAGVSIVNPSGANFVIGYRGQYAQFRRQEGMYLSLSVQY